MSWKILLAGTTSSGKTTLVKKLEELHIPRVLIGHEVARELLEKNPSLIFQPKLQEILCLEQIRRERHVDLEEYHVSLWDSGVPVNLAYANIFPNTLSSAVLQGFVQYCRTYDKIYLLDKDDIRFELTQLHHQTKGEEWFELRDRIHNSLVTTLTKYGFLVEFLSGSVEQRIEIVKHEVYRNLDKGFMQRDTKRI